MGCQLTDGPLATVKQRPAHACFVSADVEGSRLYRLLMQHIDDGDAVLAVLNDPAFMVPPVPSASAGIAWLRAAVCRFSTGQAHESRRALSIAILDAVPVESLRAGGPVDPVGVLARAIGLDEPVVDLVRDDPPVPATKRQALVATTVGGITVEAGEVVQVRLSGDLAFGAGPHRCPGREHAFALIEGALA